MIDEGMKEEVRNCMDSYSRIMDVWKANNDNYFKRGHLFMGIIQVGLFFTAFKLLSSPQILYGTVILLVLLVIMGVLSASIWIRFMKKQSQYFELLRRTLRNIESQFAEFNVPLQYFTLESLVFHGYRKHVPLHSAEAIKIKKRCLINFLWSEEQYPEFNGKENKPHTMQEVSGGLVNYEKYIAIGAIVVWFIILILAFYFFSFKNSLCFFSWYGC